MTSTDRPTREEIAEWAKDGINPILAKKMGAYYYMALDRRRLARAYLEVLEERDAIANLQLLQMEELRATEAENSRLRAVVEAAKKVVKDNPNCCMECDDSIARLGKALATLEEK